jgi:DNA polymerase bacteriophage-type
MSTKLYGLDFETYSDVNLPKHGLDRYVNDPSFKPLMASVSPNQQDFGIVRANYDFVMGLDPDRERTMFVEQLHRMCAQGYILVAHNAGFERAVLRRMQVPRQLFSKVWDSAVSARMLGAASSLANSSAQLLPKQKLEVGAALIQKFCIPNDWNGHAAPTPELIMQDEQTQDDWTTFRHYCDVDAERGVDLVEYMQETLGWPDLWKNPEFHYEPVTARMNQLGWKVDLDLVHEMQLRYEQNVQNAVETFRAKYDPKGELNLNSMPQLKLWCAHRGVKTTSFDSDHVDKLLDRVDAKLKTMTVTDPKFEDYAQVLELLYTKKEMGGSSLKKLQTIKNLTGKDGRLRDQYLHCGAGQSYRTSGRGVQMQNLKRLGSGMIEDMLTVFNQDQEYDNDQLGENLRQVFTASHADGQLIVGDFSSVESRGLAWLAGADWKIDAFRQGKDLYKVQAQSIYDVAYEDVTKAQRQTGKIGELSCGYGAGPVAVSRFAQGYGVDMDEAEALQLVRDWRTANPEVVELWDTIDTLLHKTIDTRSKQKALLANDLELHFEPIDTPATLLKQHPGAQSLVMELWSARKTQAMFPILQRVFHGCYTRGRNICIYKPSERKTGDLWSSHFVDPKTKKVRFYDIYGGKLAGILTQSMCREMFFYALHRLDKDLRGVANAKIVGQFHDEIVVDWVPPNAGTGFEFPQEDSIEYYGLSYDTTLTLVKDAMTRVSDQFKGFPLEADIKSGYRYIK